VSHEKITEKSKENRMLRPKIGKVTVNISVGKSGEPLEKAMKILEELTRQKPRTRRAKSTVRDFGIRRGEPIATLVTLRKGGAEEFLKRTLQAVENRVPTSSFDQLGNFSFGIKEHIDIPGTKYVPDLGIVGMDITVTMERPGYRVRRRHRAKSKVGFNQVLTAEESMAFIKERFGVEIS